MTDSLGTDLGRPSENREAATKATCYVVVTTDNADLLPILGLDWRGALVAKLGLDTAKPSPRDQRPVSERDEALAAAYAGGKSLEELARTTGLGYTVVRSAILRAGGTLRAQGVHHQPGGAR